MLKGFQLQSQAPTCQIEITTININHRGTPDVRRKKAIGGLNVVC